MANYYEKRAGNQDESEGLLIAGWFDEDFLAATASATLVYVNVAGVWKSSIVYVNVAGVWKLATTYVNVAGVWK
jgi:hypothetical protein